MRLRRPVKIVERVKYTADPMHEFYRKSYSGMLGAIEAEAQQHQPRADGRLPDGNYGRRWFCSECRTPWPCRFIRWADQTTGDHPPLIGLEAMREASDE